MPSPKFNITHIDGSQETAVLRPKAQIQFEEDTGDALASLDGEMKVSKLYKLAWYATGREIPFDAWIDNLEEVDMAAVPPTPNGDGEGDSEDAEEQVTRPTSSDSMPD